MHKDLMDILRCPVDKGVLELEVEEEDDEEVLEGTLTCQECQHVYRIEEGIPNLLPPDLQEEIEAELAGEGAE